MTILQQNSFAAPIRLPVGLRALVGVEFPRKLAICERLFGRALGRNGVCWVQTAPGPVWKLDLANPTHRWIVYGWYEGPSLWRWLRTRAGTVNTLVDSGANIGQTLLYFATYMPRSRIFAYEPGGSAREWLAEGVAANGFGCVTIVPAGLSCKPGSAHLGGVGGTELHGAWNTVHPTEGESISLVTLDEELDRVGVVQLDFWKLDVEGHELAALQGAEMALASGRIRAIYMEMGDAKSESVSLLARHGYKGWDLGNSGQPRPMGKDNPWGNALFLRPA